MIMYRTKIVKRCSLVSHGLDCPCTRQSDPLPASAWKLLAPYDPTFSLGVLFRPVVGRV